MSCLKMLMFPQICDPDQKILNVNAHYPGARNDYFIWQNCTARTAMERAHANGERGTWLIGEWYFAVHHVPKLIVKNYLVLMSVSQFQVMMDTLLNHG